MVYDLDWVFCKDDIYWFSEGLKCIKKGWICCYGLLGIGKMVWVLWFVE